MNKEIQYVEVGHLTNMLLGTNKSVAECQLCGALVISDNYPHHSAHHKRNEGQHD